LITHRFAIEDYAAALEGTQIRRTAHKALKSDRTAHKVVITA